MLYCYISTGRGRIRMRWFRSKRTLGGCAALVALALQLALTFAHLHPQDIFGSVQGTRLAFAAHGSVSSAGGATASLRRESKAPVEAYCDVCASINLVGSSQNPAAPHLQLPPFPGNSRPAFGGDASVAAYRHANFQSRAPPAA